MKLRNKKTGEIIDIYKGQVIIHYDSGRKTIKFKSIEELEDWEDYEEPEDFYIVEQRGTVGSRVRTGDEYEKKFKQIGNYFETKEEAELAVEKLKAFKRLKDKGFRFDGWTIDDGLRISICTNMDSEGIYDNDKKEAKKDLDICFGGEEWQRLV